MTGLILAGLNRVNSTKSPAVDGDTAVFSYGLFPEVPGPKSALTTDELFSQKE